MCRNVWMSEWCMLKTSSGQLLSETPLVNGKIKKVVQRPTTNVRQYSNVCASGGIIVVCTYMSCECPTATNNNNKKNLHADNCIEPKRKTWSKWRDKCVSGKKRLKSLSERINFYFHLIFSSSFFFFSVRVSTTHSCCWTACCTLVHFSLLLNKLYLFGLY